MADLERISNDEQRLRAAIAALRKRRVVGITLIEAIDEADLWNDAFENYQPFLDGRVTAALLERYPLFMCAIASEIGFRFEGVGTEYWSKLASALGVEITWADRSKFGAVFAELSEKYSLAKPPESAFSSHFSIISWPIVNALLPLDLLAPVTRLLSRAPATALPGPGRLTDYSRLRAWASAVEGARLTDWLRVEPASERAMSALLTDNKSGAIPVRTHARLQDAFRKNSEAHFAARAVRSRARRARTGDVSQPRFGHLTLERDARGLKMYVSWPPLPSELVNDARDVARAAMWRPQLWGSGARLHSDTALGEGPFLLTHTHVPRADEPAYPGAAATFGEGSAVAAALAARDVDWTTALLFDVSDDGDRGELRSTAFEARSGPGWVAVRAERTDFDHLALVGKVAGYRVFEVDLGLDAHQTFLSNEGLVATSNEARIARHPVDAITAPFGVVRRNRPLAVYRQGPPISVDEIKRLEARSDPTNITSDLRVRLEPEIGTDIDALNLSLLERDSAYSGLIEKRLNLRVESPYGVRDVPLTAEVEINGSVALRCVAIISELPATVDFNSTPLRALYSDVVRNALLESGQGLLRFAVGRLAKIETQFTRPKGLVDWSSKPPRITEIEASAELVSAPAAAPHRFTATDDVVQPDRGAMAYGLRLASGQIADPIQVFASPQFNLGDLVAVFGNDIGSRLLRDGGRGTGEIARCRIAWSRAECRSLQALAAKARIVDQFEYPLIYNLCGRDWTSIELADDGASLDPYELLYYEALNRGLATLPEGASEHAVDFAKAFAANARQLDPNWLHTGVPLDNAMDTALNLGFAESVLRLQAGGDLLHLDPNDCDFGSPQEEWTAAGGKALGRARREKLVRLIAPSDGGLLLRDRDYSQTGIAEMAEDLAAWTRNFALPRGQLRTDAAAAALQLWLSPSACEGIEAALHVLINDPFVARATRYAAVRMKSSLHGATS